LPDLKKERDVVRSTKILLHYIIFVIVIVVYFSCKYQPNKGKSKKLRDALDNLYAYLDGQQSNTQTEVC